MLVLVVFSVYRRNVRHIQALTHHGAYRLTGLLSFMLSDEMTTGSVTSSDGHKRAYAARSHSFNLSQPRFKEAFPDVSDLFSISSL